jgi:hypothetical protein
MVQRCTGNIKEYYIINLSLDYARRSDCSSYGGVPHTDGHRFYRSSEQSYHVDIDFASVVVVLIEHSASDRDITIIGVLVRVSFVHQIDCA